MNRRASILFCVVTAVLYAWPLWCKVSHSKRPPVGFALHQPAPRPESGPFMRRAFLGAAPDSKMVHAPSLCELGDGSLAAVWYGGTREGAKDVAIFLSTRQQGEASLWAPPRQVVTRESASEELGRYVRKLGNAVIFADPSNRLWLFYVTVCFGGWSGSSINAKCSPDGGLTWGESRRLFLSPFLNLSELVKNNPVPMRDTTFAVPIYHEFVARFPEMLWITPTEDGLSFSYKKTRMGVGGRNFIQPSVVVYDRSEATAFFRTCSLSDNGARALTDDGGVTWSDPSFFSLPNPDSGVNALGLSGGRTLLAFNDCLRKRGTLGLAISSDRGETWVRVTKLEEEEGEKFSYPYMVQSRSGCIHLVYTWKRKRIRHMMFNEAWLLERMSVPLL